MDERELRVIQAKKRKVVKWVIIAAIILAVLGGAAALFVIQNNKPDEKPGVFYPSVGHEHIAINAELPAPYNSNPPSSGGHFSKPANWEIYDYEGNDRIFIHNLEHGGIWIAYKPSVAAGVVDDLKSIVEEFSRSKIVMAPRSANDADIALVAWTRVLKFDLSGSTLTEEQKDQIRAFYKSYKNRGPEFVPDTMPGVDPKSVK